MKTLTVVSLAAGVSVPMVVQMLAAEVQALRVPSKMPDAAELLSPGAIRLEGFLGERVAVNAGNRLIQVDLEPLLEGFRKKPGSHPWIGEHIGKWMHAATLAWAYGGDAALRQKLDYAAAELVRAQEPDGYLGTYVPEKRFGLYPGADWDVWSHKYNLIGLLTYHQFTGDRASLEASRKIGDLLIRTFGPGKKSIIAAGTHVGMAATSVLEPMVSLYRSTGDARYLDFAFYVVQAWNEPNGPKIIDSLRKTRQVNRTANGKAYEMLSNLVGLCELARATGNSEWLEPVLIAWSDIVDQRLYLTGSASQGEHFRGDFELPNTESAHVAETCVTTTWIQLNLQLLRLTGEARFGDQLEKTFYNHLAAAQHPRGDDWCYFTPLEGAKSYRSDVNCCHSSGPRGMALAPCAAVLKGPPDAQGREVAIVNLLGPAKAALRLEDREVTLEQITEFPRSGRVTFAVRLTGKATFGLKIRVPAWSGSPAFRPEGGAGWEHRVEDGWFVLPARVWENDDRFTLEYAVRAQVVQGDHGNLGRVALRWGPLVLAYDEHKNPGLPRASTLALAPPSEPALVLNPGDPLSFQAAVISRRNPQPQSATFVPFADAGSDGGVYRVWLRAPGAGWPEGDSVLVEGEESRSRAGNQNGSINDGDPGSIVVTYDGRSAPEDWYAVRLPEPVSVRRVVYAHGKSFHDGGWFDSSTGQPRIQVQRQANSPWETLGTLADYPATTGTDNRGLQDGQRFTLRLAEPVNAVAVRVVGKPSCGDNPAQAFSSCGELEAFAD